MTTTNTKRLRVLSNIYYPYFKNIVSVVIPILVLSVAILAIIKPTTMDWIAQEDNIVEIVSAGALLTAALIAFIFSISVAKKYSSLILTISVVLIGILFFVIGMEEISWMQRILNVESNEFFLANNAQFETNFHNFATHFSEAAYYTGAFIFLSLLPFFHKYIDKLFSKNNVAAQLRTLLPSSWLFVPFAAVSGLSYAAYAMVGTILTLFVCMWLIHYIAWPLNLDTNKSQHITYFSLLSLVSIVVAYITFMYLDYSALGVRYWVASEYREMFIGAGLLVYICDVVIRERINIPRNAKR